MDKQHIVREVGKRCGLNQSVVAMAFDAIMQIASESLARGERVLLRGVGTIKSYSSPARTVTNPKTGAPVQVRAKWRIRFTPDPHVRKL